MGDEVKMPRFATESWGDGKLGWNGGCKIKMPLDLQGE